MRTLNKRLSGKFRLEENNIVDIARELMNIFESVISSQIQTHKLALAPELYEFVKKEQERIDRIIDAK